MVRFARLLGNNFFGLGMYQPVIATTTFFGMPQIK